MRTHGRIHGEPIRWHTGASAQPGHRNLTAVVWVNGEYFMHCRPVSMGRGFMGSELWRALLRRELTKAEHEIRKRVRGAH